MLRAVTIFPTVEGMQEFKVQTNSMSAGYGGSGGGVVNIVTKSGTNEYHGAAFEFLRITHIMPIVLNLRPCTTAGIRSSVCRSVFASDEGPETGSKSFAKCLMARSTRFRIGCFVQSAHNFRLVLR